jgi:hypothetical protein
MLLTLYFLPAAVAQGGKCFNASILIECGSFVHLP